MKALIQKVSSATVFISNNKYSSIESGLLILLGITHNDNHDSVINVVNKIINLRIFPDKENKMNQSLIDVNGSILVVSQFTLYGDCKKGRRPSFTKAANPKVAEPIYLDFINTVKNNNIKVANGQFGSNMDIHIINNGPLTFMVES